LWIRGGRAKLSDAFFDDKRILQNWLRNRQNVILNLSAPAARSGSLGHLGVVNETSKQSEFKHPF